MGCLQGIHVVIVPSWWPSPEEPVSGVFNMDYARAFAAAGAKVGVIFPDLVSLRRISGRNAVPWMPAISEESVDAIPVVRVRGVHTALGIPAIQMNRFRRWLKTGLTHYRTRHGEPDLLHAMCAIPAGWACTHLAEPLENRVIVTEHTGPFSLVMDGGGHESHARSALKKARNVVAVSQHLGRQMLEAGAASKIEVCGNPIGNEFHLQTARSNENEAPSCRAVFVGRLAREKGIEELIAASTLIQREQEIQWCFVGDGPLAPMLRSRMKSEGCVLLGDVNKQTVAATLASSDFLVLPTHGEVFGLAVAEALCMGLPVLTSRGTACADFVGPDDGVLIEPQDVDSLVKGLREMIRRLPQFDRAGIAARARERFSPDAVARKYNDLFRPLVK